MRLLLGIFEAGLFPALTFLLSTIYNRESQGKRVAVLYGATALSGAFGGLIAYGIQLMGARRGLEAWRWLFIIEGVISIVICSIALFTLPKSAEDAWFLTDEEKKMMQTRKQRDVIYKGEDKFNWTYAKMALVDPVIWVAGFSLFCAGIPLFGFGTFLPTILRGLGLVFSILLLWQALLCEWRTSRLTVFRYTSLQANYLTIPVYVFACVILAGITYLSDRIGKRAIVAVCVPIPVMIGYAIVLGTPKLAAGYFAMFLCSAGKLLVLPMDSKANTSISLLLQYTPCYLGIQQHHTRS